MKLLKLTGKYAVGEHEFTMVDDEDYEILKQIETENEKEKNSIGQ